MSLKTKDKKRFVLTLALLVVSSCLYLAASLWIEFKNIFYPEAYLYTQVFLTLMMMVSFYAWVGTVKSLVRVHKFLTILFITILVVFAVQYILRYINIYRFGPLPIWFYHFKLHRLITLSTLFFVKLLTTLGSLIVVTNLYKQVKTYRFAKLQLFFCLSVLLVFLFQLQVSLAKSLADTLLAAQSLGTPYPDRFTYQNGGLSYHGWIWPYTRFINAHTPENAVIMIPPQSNVWKMEGNESYLRWFIYPRKIVKPNEKNEWPISTQFILIAQGECQENKEKEGYCGWPKVFIPKEKIQQIFFINRENLVETTITGVDFEPLRDQMQWGMIELKR